jgi:hypothetical protein
MLQDAARLRRRSQIPADVQPAEPQATADNVVRMFERKLAR